MQVYLIWLANQNSLNFKPDFPDNRFSGTSASELPQIRNIAASLSQFTRSHLSITTTVIYGSADSVV